MKPIYGQCLAKRALEIAITGGHTIALVGPRGTGKNFLVARYPQAKARAFQLCLCGNQGSVIRECICDSSATARTLPVIPATVSARYKRALLKRLHGYEILVEVIEVSLKERYMRQEDWDKEVVWRNAQIAAGQVHLAQLPDLGTMVRNFPDATLRIEEIAVRRLGLSMQRHEFCRSVARTICALRQGTVIEARDIAEAFQYSRVFTCELGEGLF